MPIEAIYCNKVSNTMVEDLILAPFTYYVLLTAYIFFAEMCSDFKIITSNKYDRSFSTEFSSYARIRTASISSSGLIYATISTNMFLDGSSWTTSFSTNGIWGPKAWETGQVLILIKSNQLQFNFYCHFKRIKRVELLIEPGQSLGLMIRGGVEYGLGIFITGVDKDSVADRAGLMVCLKSIKMRM